MELGKGKEGMIHISKFGVPTRVANVNDVAKVGEMVKVKVYKVEKDKNRIGLEKILSDEERAKFTEMKAELKTEEKKEENANETK